MWLLILRKRFYRPRWKRFLFCPDLMRKPAGTLCVFAGFRVKNIQNFNHFYHMANYNYLTQGGYERIKHELEELKTTGRAEAAYAIAEARSQGDLSENAEYDAAKDAQGLLELKISELETVMSNARVIDESQIDTSKVAILVNVTIKNTKTGKEMTYKLVSESEADAKSSKISITSPIGKGLLGKAIGEKAQIQTPGGPIEFEIVDISI